MVAAPTGAELVLNRSEDPDHRLDGTEKHRAHPTEEDIALGSVKDSGTSATDREAWAKRDAAFVDNHLGWSLFHVQRHDLEGVQNPDIPYYNTTT